jgi:hypothetical protein
MDRASLASARFEYERRILPLRFRELRNGRGIRPGRRLCLYREDEHVTGQDSSQRLFVRANKVVAQFLCIRARTCETRERRRSIAVRA